MTSNRDRLGGFEERLLGELKSVVAQRKAEQSGLSRARTPLWRRRRVVSVASAGALAIGAAVGIPLLGGESTAPSASAAYTVTVNDNGSITVTIYRFDDADGLEAQLDEHGVAADVSYMGVGERCQPGRFELSPTQHQVDVANPIPAGIPDNMNDVELSFTLNPSDFQADETLVVENEWVAADTDPKPGAVQLFQLTHVVTAIGPVQPCELDAD